MTIAHETDDAIRERGLRRTLPRALVARALRSASGHRSAAEVQETIEREFAEGAGIARSSVYRALEALEGAGLVVSLRAAQEEVRYEWADRLHHHLICDGCGHISEVSLDAVRAIEDEASEEHGFVTRVRHLALRGTCRGCRADGESAGRTGRKISE